MVVPPGVMENSVMPKSAVPEALVWLTNVLDVNSPRAEQVL